MSRRAQGDAAHAAGLQQRPHYRTHRRHGSARRCTRLTMAGRPRQAAHRPQRVVYSGALPGSEGGDLLGTEGPRVKSARLCTKYCCVANAAA